MVNKKWTFLNKDITAPQISAICQKFGVSPMIATVLLNRTLTDDDNIKMYLTKSIGDIHHPHLLKDAQKAAQRILEAIDKDEKIVIYGDYDVDGITSCALLYHFLRSRGAKVEYYIPSRADEGYGINILALQKIRKTGASLLITVDCGITAVGEVEFAKTIGLEIIITDHHTCKEETPRAYAVVNPRQPDCPYPCKHLAGVGVAFKVMLAIVLELGLNTKEYFLKYIDFVAIGTVADVVPLTDENRIFVSVGVKKIEATDNFGLMALISSAGVAQKRLSAGMISFILAPRINAAGRVGDADLGVRLLGAESYEEAYSIALQLESENRERQQTEQEILKEALEMIESDPDFAKRKVFVLAKSGWHHGVIGIVASRIVDRYYRPAILLSISEDQICKGSGRSIKGFNLFNALTQSADYLIKYGGHELAAGLSIHADDLEAFSTGLNEIAAKTLPDELMVPNINIDASVTMGDLTLENAGKLSVLEPFGMGNAQPVFAMSGAQLVCARSLSGGRHCKLTLAKDGRTLDFLAFGMGDLGEKFVVGTKVDAAFSMDVGAYNGTAQLQLVLKDIRHCVSK